MRISSWIAVGLMICAATTANAQKQVKRKTTTTRESKPSPHIQPATPGRHATGSVWTVPMAVTDPHQAELPSAEEMSALGAEAFRRNAYAEAIQWCELAAGQGSADAQMLLGDIYLYGKGTEENHITAAGWYRKAAEQGLPRAQFILATLLYFGDGVEQDYDEAHAWTVKGAENGDPGAQFLLGEMYAEGHGVEASREEAAKWYRKAAEQGNAAAQAALDDL